MQTSVSRRMLLAGAGLVLGASALPASAQQAAERRTPENETRWARLGVSLTGKTALVTGSTDGLGKELSSGPRVVGRSGSVRRTDPHSARPAGLARQQRSSRQRVPSGRRASTATSSRSPSITWHISY